MSDWSTGWTNSGGAINLRRHDTRCDVSVMLDKILRSICVDIEYKYKASRHE